jgi:hypothetical protein
MEEKVILSESSMVYCGDSSQRTEPECILPDETQEHDTRGVVPSSNHHRL